LGTESQWSYSQSIFIRTYGRSLPEPQNVSQGQHSKGCRVNCHAPRPYVPAVRVMVVSLYLMSMTGTPSGKPFMNGSKEVPPSRLRKMQTSLPTKIRWDEWQKMENNYLPVPFPSFHFVLFCVFVAKRNQQICH